MDNRSAVSGMADSQERTQERIDRVAQLLDEAGRAHHKAYFETDGFDPEWPLWYAEYLLDKLRTALDAQFTKSELVYLLVLLDREQRMIAPGATWTLFYARELVRRYC
jgi:hypothetical protein